MAEIIEVIQRYEVPKVPDLDLPEEDGEPLESNWHRAQINLLIDVVYQRWHDRQDFFAGGNMFIYYSTRQIRQRDYKGPDFFLVKEIDGSYPRQQWVIWEEDGRFPNVIIELLSPTTASEDLGRKKQIYERNFRTPDYFCYDPYEDQLWGWRLSDQRYVLLEPDDEGRLWSAELDAWIGTWQGEFLHQPGLWLRLFDDDGRLLPTEVETKELELEAAEAELARLHAELEQLRKK